MLLLNTPLVMVVAFLVLTLAVGLYFSKRKTTLQEYAIGNKQFTTATLVATVLATGFSGGGLISMVKQVHNTGLYCIVIIFSTSLGYWLTSVLALRMGSFMQHLSMPETIGKVYGEYPRGIVALSSILRCITVIAMQISIVSKTLTTLRLGNAQLTTIFAILVLVCYSAFGGVRAVLFTDVLQFITFALIIPLISYYMFLNTGKTLREAVSFLFTKEKFQFQTFWATTNLPAITCLILGFTADQIAPTTIQRIYMSSGSIQAKKVFRYAGFFSLFIKYFIISIGIFVFVAVPELPKADIWGYIIAHIPPIFTGFVSVSLLAMAMSTADSCLNACAIMVSHDIVEGIRGAKAVPYLHSLRIARLATLGVSIAAIILVFYINDLLKLVILSLNLSLSIVTAPFILAVYGFRSSSHTALIGMATGALTIYMWNKWIEPTTGIDGSFICMVANGLAMLASHYLLPQPTSSG